MLEQTLSLYPQFADFLEELQVLPIIDECYLNCVEPFDEIVVYNVTNEL